MKPSLKKPWSAFILQKVFVFKLVLVFGILSPLIVTSCKRTVPDASVTFGKLVTTSNVDSKNAPTALAEVFSPQQKTIYVVAEAKDIAPGTRLASSWSREGTVIKVSDEVVATHGYHDTNIEFHLDPGADGWLPGKYKVTILANGQTGPGASFTIK